jgi:sortase A
MGADIGLFTSPPRPRRRMALVVLERLLLLVALASLGYVAGTVGGAALYQDYESRQLDAILRSGPQPSTPAGSVTPAPSRRIIGRIEIPRLGVSTIIKNGDDARTLDLAVGHIRGTAMPGAPGNIGLAGHRDTFFRRLRDIKSGDLIRLVAPEGIFDYVVERTHVVAPKDVWVLDATPEPALTLVTCYPFTYVGAAPDRFIVRARLAPEASREASVQPASYTRPANWTPPAATDTPKPLRAKRVARTRPPAPVSPPIEATTPESDDATPRAPAKRPPRPIAWWHTMTRGH